MKKIVSLILAALMLCALCAPAFAEDEPTEVKPIERTNYKFIEINDAGNYIIKGDYSVKNIRVGSTFMTDVTLTIPKGVTVTVTGNFNNFGTINVCGTLILSGSEGFKDNSGTINIMSCCGGKLEGTFNESGTINTYDEHNFENDKCTYCGTYKCEITGKHTFVDGKCVCGTYECMGTAKHNWVNGVCSVCNTPCEHKWDTNTGKCTVCELVCTHGGDKCDICGKELVNLNAGSALSEGNMIIICSVATLVIGLCGGFIIGTKKKKKTA